MTPMEWLATAQIVLLLTGMVAGVSHAYLKMVRVTREGDNR